MAANPEAELALKSISFCEAAEQQRIRKRFEQAGLDSERLILLDWVEGGLNHLQRYSEIDVALDPIPYGGATTTAEALWMGVPVVALAGEGMVDGSAASLLIHGNQANWVAKTTTTCLSLSSCSRRPRDGAERLKLRQEQCKIQHWLMAFVKQELESTTGNYDKRSSPAEPQHAS